VISPDVQTLLLSAAILRTRRALFLQSAPERLMRHGLTGRFVDRHLDRVLCCSRFIADRARRTPVDAAKLAIVLNGVRLPAERPFVDRRPVRLGIVGRIVDQKQHGVLLEACVLLRQRLPEAFSLDIVGTREGPFAAELESRIAALGLADIVRWAGFIADRDQLYGDLDVLVAPAVDEPFGLTVPEAGSYGLPVVAARSGAFPELIEENRTGLLFEPGDATGLAQALERLVADAALRRRLGEAARAHVGTRFTVDNMTEQFLSATSR
jgi:glycosyltransferase involved in cell wall biosynthesis